MISPDDKLFETREARELFLSHLHALTQAGRHREVREIMQGLAMLHALEIVRDRS